MQNVTKFHLLKAAESHQKRHHLSVHFQNKLFSPCLTVNSYFDLLCSAYKLIAARRSNSFLDGNGCRIPGGWADGCMEKLLEPAK